MFCLKTALLNIKRRKQKSILVVLISLLIASFAFVYVGGVQTNEHQLAALPQAIPVTARIENLDGSEIAGLEISGKTVDAINDSGYVKDLYYSVQIRANFSSIPDESEKAKEIELRAVNDINAIPNYQDLNIELDGSVTLDFLRGNEAKCIADYDWLQRNDLSVGDTIELNLYCLKYEPKDYAFRCAPLGTYSLLIAGSMTSSAEVAGSLLCPAAWVKEKHRTAGETFLTDSAMFTVADPLHLDEFKAAMKKLYLMPINPVAENARVYGNALSVQDEIFIKTATRIMSTLSVLYTFAAVIIVVVALTGYALAYLFMQTRRIEVVLMRSLGTTRRECMFVMFYEYAALGLFGSLLGMLGSAIIAGSAGAIQILAFLVFLVSFAGGIAGAASRLCRQNIMSGFIKAEA